MALVVPTCWMIPVTPTVITLIYNANTIAVTHNCTVLIGSPPTGNIFSWTRVMFYYYIWWAHQISFCEIINLQLVFVRRKWPMILFALQTTYLRLLVSDTSDDLNALLYIFVSWGREEIEDDIWAGGVNCLCAQERVILVFISGVVKQRGKYARK